MKKTTVLALCALATILASNSLAPRSTKINDDLQAEAVMQSLARAAITVVRNNDNLLPLQNLDKHSIAVVTIGENGEKYSSLEGAKYFIDMCGRYTHIDTYSADGGISDATLSSIKNHDVVIACVCSDNQSARNSLAKIASASRHPVATFLINPCKMAKFKNSLANAQAIVTACDDTPQSQDYAAQAIFGGIDVDGTLPVNISGVAPAGTGIKLQKTRLGFGMPAMAGMNNAVNDSISAICSQAVDAGAFPGCRVLVAKDGIVVVDQCHGTIAADSHTPVNSHTLYDLASVSKAIGTLPGVMKAYDLGLFNLDQAASDYIPGLKDNPDKKNITVRQLLYHESGMQPSLNMFTTMMDTATYKAPIIKSKPDTLHSIKIQDGAWGATGARLRSDITSFSASPSLPVEAAKGIYVGTCTYDTIMRRIYTSPLRKNNSYCYSCLNFCLLMDMEQNITGRPHQQWVQDSIWAPLGAYNMCYRPTLSHSLNSIAATERDNYLRKQLVHGYVHDELAAFSGGVQGNAGLFSDAYDIAKICQMWLWRGTYGGARILSPQTVNLFLNDKSPNSRRGLGFDKPDTDNPDKSPTFAGAPPSVIGHTGFTGTIFWIDPQSNIIFIFLCNRVNPSRDNAAFSRMNIRPALFEQVYKSLN